MSIQPFTAKMETSQFMQMAQAFRDRGKTLVETYEDAETVHEAFFRQNRYESFESFKKEYYKYHPAKKG